MTMENKAHSGFILYKNFFTQFSMLDLEDRGRLITAIFELELGQEPTLSLSPAAAMAFSFIKDTLIRDRESYDEICRRNAENGKKGGRPKKREPSGEDGGADASRKKTQKTEGFCEKPKKMK